MTKSQYEDYQKRYAEGTKGFEIISQSYTGEDEDASEPSFSWSPCEICGSHLGGDRYDMTMTNPGPKSESIEVSACSDCLYYSEYGQLDDMTMLEIEGR